ncbi:hypothetical protein [Jidongwangia harbinensis]|uniref:hypothetical protein n=1 Tax=Jidongwangia harbinensis TaxID=2878561 RepID=UPI001CD93985|nr:hypothetical protein [Jidongwangia harbinensis]MCA2211791.1 hypothetical protein [Jidongwangia harbinensis]
MLAPDPDHVRTPDQFVAALNALRGKRSYKALVRAHPALRQSTLGDLLTGRSTPTRETVTAFLTACGLDQPAQRPWLAAQDRTAAARPGRPAGAVRVRTAVARRLGVHPSIQTSAGADALPDYVPRDFDAELRRMLRPGAFVLLRGGSSTGKTRALFEAVREALPEWWLLHGDRDGDGEPGPRTVLWLDELQRCPVPPGRMRSVLATGAIVVATLWPDEYNCRTAPRTPGHPDPYAAERELLGLAQVIDVPDEFSPAERRLAEILAAGDRRLRIALDSTDAGVTQVLAAGPELVRRWANADNTDPRQYAGRAIVTAALDARRVGARTPVTRDYLAAAAPAYLTAAQRAAAPPDWLDRALDYATTRLHGAAACLTPMGAGMAVTAGYRTADYLHQHARLRRRTEPLPDAAWQALVDRHPDDTFDLADSAVRRGRPDIARLLRGRVPPAERLRHYLDRECHRTMVSAVIRDGVGDADEQVNALLAAGRHWAELRERSDAGRPGAARHLIDGLTRDGDLDALHAEMHAGTPLAADRLAALGRSAAVLPG